MPPNDQQNNAHHLDADAVCGVCGMVNPEGTLLCKSCGNNLRDQRMHRMAHEAPLESAETTGSRQGWALRIVAVIGLVLLLMVIVNLAAIEDILADLSAPVSARGVDVWEGPVGLQLDALVERLRALRPGAEAIREAVNNPLNTGEGLSGTYGLVRVSGIGPQPVGAALVEEVGEDIYFVALLDDGAEIRGIARRQGTSGLIADWESAQGVFVGSRHSVAGIAQRMTEGCFTCAGSSTLDEKSYEFVACPIAP